jgi:hypothetical protein
MPVLIENKSEESDSYPTLFGFPTKNGFASKSLNFIYIIVMVVAVAFAYHALSLILTGWNTGLIFLASLAVVGLPYCVKIVMYGKEVFEYKMAVLCVLISLLPTIFDFVGFYSETSIKQSLTSKKFEVLEIVNYFDKEARKSITKKIENSEKEYANLVAKTQQDLNLKTRELNDKINKSKQLYIDETEGVKGKTTSGNAGIGPKAKELEADMRKIAADVELDKKTLAENNIRDLEKIKKEYEIKQESLKKGIESIDGLLGEDGLIFKVNKAENFIQLADVSVKLNSAINIVSSKLDVEPKYIKFESENVIQLSFGALLRGEITAIICFLLAILLEVVDTIIVYMVRGVKTDKKKKYEEPVDNLRSRTYYDY